MVPIFGERELLFRLTRQAKSNSRNIVFLVGSPLVAPVRPGEPGVPGVAGMISLIQEELEGQVELPSGTPMESYQEAFLQLLGRCGQEGVNRIIRRAVLRARKEPPIGTELSGAEAGRQDICLALERDFEGWSLNSAVESLGRILAEYPEQFGEMLLTSNFDPLIEVSLRKAGAGLSFRTIPLHADASLSLSKGDGCNVVHFHGYWSESDTFHMSWQLQHPRPQLLSSLAALLRERTVVVVAYGGWDDVFTRALASISQEVEAFPEVLWLFRETEPEQIRKGFLERIGSLELVVTRGRLVLYGGIDVLAFFPNLLRSLQESLPRTSSLPQHVHHPEPLVEPLDLPPDDGLATQLTTEGLPALSIRESNFRALPLDLGTAWGLERGAFSILLVGGGAEDRAYRTLVRSEEALWRASRGRKNVLSLPIRWWLQIGPELPRIPETAAEVWAAPRDSRSVRLAYLRSQGLHKDLLPGFFLVAPAAGKGLSPELLLWWKALLKIFSALPVAVAVHLDLQGGALTNGIQEIERRVGTSAARLDVLRLLDCGQDADEPVPTVAAPLPALAQGLMGEPSIWLGIEADAKKISPADGEVQAAALIRQFESLETAPSAGAVYEFMAWITRPELICPLLRTSAHSSSPAVRRGSLIFAAQIDSRMDAWLEGDPGEAALEDLAGLADPAGRPVFEDIVLALMRRSRRATGAAKWESILAKLSEQLGPELLIVDRLRQGASQEAVDGFLLNCGPGEHRLALRAGLDLWPSRTLLQSLDIEQVDLWRLLTALPVNSERVGDLLAIEDPACRAVFGLCTPREWQGVQRDKILASLVLDARRYRPLTFPNGSDS